MDTTQASGAPDPASNGRGKELSIFNDDLGKRPRQDARLARMAARNRWPVPPAVQARVVEKATDLLDSGNDDKAIAAMKFLREAVGHNIQIDIEADRAADPAQQPTQNVIVIQPPPNPRDRAQTP